MEKRIKKSKEIQSFKYKNPAIFSVYFILDFSLHILYNNCVWIYTFLILIIFKINLLT